MEIVMKKSNCWIVLLCVFVLFVLSGCGGTVNGKDEIVEKAKAAWTAATSKSLSDNYSISHIHFTSRAALRSACGIKPSGSNFTSCGFFSKDGGDLFGFHIGTQTYYVVAMDNDGKVTWCFDVRNWNTKTGRHGLGTGMLALYELNSLQIAVTKATQGNYPAEKTADDNEWHKLTVEQITQICENE
ncbi:MAG: hypothetical protein K5919_03635 [Clostridiales bacterium]|nr:hypothetical protein [Clostridiales bacterium]